MTFLARLLLVALLAFPAPVAAQVVPDSTPTPADARTAVVFVYLQFGDTLAFEAVYSDSSIVRGAYLERRGQRVHWDHLVANGTPGTLAMSVYLTDSAGAPIQELAFVPKTDSMQLLSRDPSGQRDETIAVPDGTVAAFGRSLSHLAYLGFYAVQRRRTSLPLLLTSSGKTVTAAIEVAGEQLALIVDGLRIDTLWDGGMLREARVPSQGLVMIRQPRP